VSSLFIVHLWLQRKRHRCLLLESHNLNELSYFVHPHISMTVKHWFSSTKRRMPLPVLLNIPHSLFSRLIVMFALALIEFEDPVTVTVAAPVVALLEAMN